MDIYKIKSFILIFFIYLIAMLPSFFIFVKAKKYEKNELIKLLAISTLIEIAIFSLIYIFPRNTIKIFNVSQNIENYSIYALKITFIASIFTPLHYALPIILFKNKKKKKAIMLFSLKILYIPIFVILNLLFPTKIALFSVPILDIFYSIFLILNIVRNNI